MGNDFYLLLASTMGISLMHTLTGPDHYLPFVALSKSGRWSKGKTLFWTFACGFGHVLASVIIGLLGVVAGWSIYNVSAFDELRGGLAAYMLLLLGLGYLIFGIYNLNRNKLHKHFEPGEFDDIYVYEHRDGEVVSRDKKFKVTPFVLFFIFLLGPTEPILPILFYPAANHSIYEITALVLVYGVVSIGTMLFMVQMIFLGVNVLDFTRFEKYIEVLSGLIIILCGIGMIWLNW